ncbi:MAG: hypothetical protein R3A44_38770 [Caldilineaceae bacterium]
MQTYQLRRLLFCIFLAGEEIILLREKERARTQIPMPRLPILFFPLFLAPLIFRSRSTLRTEKFALSLQVAGWFVELLAMFQLARRGSFGVHPTAAKAVVRDGIYRLEHPIYCGILLNLIGWAMPIPICLIAPLLAYLGLRQAVRQERVHLETLGVKHRGFDSFLWDG